MFDFSELVYEPSFEECMDPNYPKRATYVVLQEFPYSVLQIANCYVVIDTRANSIVRGVATTDLGSQIRECMCLNAEHG